MPLKEELLNCFKSNNSSIEITSKNITSCYEKVLKESTDLLGNKWENVNMDILQKSIEAQFNLSFKTKDYLKFDLIANGLVTSWSSATLLLPAIPPPGMTLVMSGTNISSTITKIPPLVEPSSDYNNIVNSFFNLFVNHAKTLSFNYIGLSLANTPITIPISSLVIK